MRKLKIGLELDFTVFKEKFIGKRYQHKQWVNIENIGIIKYIDLLELFMKKYIILTLALALMLPSPILAFPYANSVSYDTGTAPRHITVADFDGDNKPDIAAALFDTNQVGIFLNTGDGAMGAISGYNTGRGPFGVTSADYDKDGSADLATANDTDNSISVLLGNGNGKFGASTDYAAGSDPRDIISADFDNDTYTDIAVVNMSDGSVSVYINRQDGTFGAKVDYASGLYPTGLAAADMDQDGYMDIAVANSCAGCFVPYNNGSVSLLLNQQDGTFAAAATYSTGKGAMRIKCADFDGDAYPDAAVTVRNNNGIGVLLNLGDGTLGAVASYVAGSTPHGIAGGDFDGDGDEDILSANNGTTMNLFRNNSDGTFLATFRENEVTTPAYPLDAEMADMDGNGNLEIIASNVTDQKVTIHFDGIPPTITTLSPTSAYEGSAYSNGVVTGTGYNHSSIVRVNGTDVTTNYISATSLGFTIGSTFLQNEGTLGITVYNPNGGSESGSAAFTVLASQGGGSMPSEAFAQPTEPQGGLHVTINNGDTTTASKKVNIKFNYKSANQPAPVANRFAISNTPDFANASIMPLSDYDENGLQWDLCSTLNGMLPALICSNGEYTVYVKYYTAWGQQSAVVKDSINLNANGETTQKASANEPQNRANFAEFENNLRSGMRGSEVKRLQQFLNSQGITVASEGPGSPGNETEFFGAATFGAVVRFQEKYFDEILKPSNLSGGTGYFGPSSRAFANSLLK